jgi:monoamine oxidase
MPKYDVIVVGAGLAGLAAARDLAARGRTVLVVEARDRLGGRVWVRRFAGYSLELDFGGTWILPHEHQAVVEELDRYGIGTLDTPVPARFVNVLGDERTSTSSIADAELAALDAACRDVAGRASLATALRDAAVTPLAQCYARAYTRYLYGADPAEVAPSRGGTFIEPDHYSTKIAGGTRSLVEALAADAAVALRLSAPVVAIAQTAAGVSVTLASGERLAAAAAVIALPVNVWKTIAFHPALSGAKATLASDGHAGHSVKTWAIVTGAPDIVRGLADDGPIAYLRTERLLPDGRSLLVGFGADPTFDPTDRAAVERAIRRFLPDAAVIASDGHDWNTDPYARGTWFAPRPDQADLPDVRQAQGRLTFAGGDLSEATPGTINGAIDTGRAAAQEVAAILGKP